MRRSLLSLLLGILVWTHFASLAQAHQVSLSYSTAELSEDALRVDFEIRLNSKDLYIALRSAEPGDTSNEQIKARAETLQDYVFSHIDLSVPGQDCPLKATGVIVVGDGPRFAQVSARLRCERPIKSFLVDYELFFELDPRHEGLLRFPGGVVQFTNHHRRETHIWGHQSVSGFGFVRSGTWHVLSGTDHILFLLTLLLVIGIGQDHGRLRARTTAESLRNAASIVTAFTLGHSITLVMASLNWVSLPSRLVESLIAASIVYVAIENILRLEPPKRYLVTLSFGLMHGLGFAAMLRPLLPRDSALFPLFLFNVGVELGQLVIVVAALPLLMLVLHALQVVRFRKWVSVPLSVVLGAVGLVWLMQRALL